MSIVNASQSESLTVDAAARLARLLQLLAADPDNTTLRHECVALALQQRDYDLCLRLTAAGLQADPTDQQAQFDRASALIGKQDYQAALNILQVLRQAGITAVAVLQNAGLCHYLLADYAAARELLAQVYARGTHSPDVLRLLLSSLHHLNLTQEALVIAATPATVAAATDDAALCGVLALLYLDVEQVAAAARFAARAVALQPNSIDGLVVQATLRVAAQDFTIARQQFQYILNLAPETARAWLGLSLVSLAEHDLAQAHEQIKHSLTLMPQHIGSWHVLAWINLLQDNLDAAQATFEQAMQLDRNFAETHGGLAVVAAMRGNRTTAQKYIEVAERLNAQCLAAQYARSVLLNQAGDAQAAKAMLLSALTGLMPNNAAALNKILATYKHT